MNTNRLTVPDTPLISILYLWTRFGLQHQTILYSEFSTSQNESVYSTSHSSTQKFLPTNTIRLTAPDTSLLRIIYLPTRIVLHHQALLYSEISTYQHQMVYSTSHSSTQYVIPTNTIRFTAPDTPLLRIIYLPTLNVLHHLALLYSQISNYQHESIYSTRHSST